MPHPFRTRVKVCGITRPQDALAATAAGADAIGLVFYAKSPRAIDISQAKAILAALPAFVTTVGLFVNASSAELNEVLAQLPLDLLQFHGDETGEYCAAAARPYIKAIRMQPGLDLPAKIAEYPDARGILLDAWDKNLYGGTGQSFDWSLLGNRKEDEEPGGANVRIILAGGLTPANVAQAIQQTSPWAVDVSSGVESGPGIKSEHLINEFFNEVQRV